MEKRLIDPEDFLDLFYVASAGQDKAFVKTVEMVVEDTPTVDAVPVVHGKWELRNVTSGINGRYWCCTACGCIRSYWEYEPDDNYCPNCGAKMDG